ncbi:MAG: zinc-binding alcohol dehydrogenase [Verrucomicrobia bacterium]|nr:zinc-binding alcohol dehydrogenase [Verrucomicrobiota bacterium]
MKSSKIVFIRPWQVELGEAELPHHPPEAHQVYLRNLYSLVSPGTELACLSGGETWFPLPGTPGYVGVGEVLAVGDQVTKVAIGDKALTYGPHAGVYAVDTLDRHTGMCLKLDANSPRLDLVPFTRTATIPFTAIRVSEIELGDWVVVTGLGLIGNFAAQLARLQGANVIGVDVSASRRETASRCGIEHTVDSSDPAWKDAVRQLAGSRGVTTLIDATGLSAVIADAAELVASYGEAILLGSPRAEYVTDVTKVFNRIHLPGFTQFKGALEWRYPTFRDEFVKHSIERNSEIVLELIAANRLAVEPLYTHKLNPEQAGEGYRGLREDKEKYLGVIFDWTEFSASGERGIRAA